MTGSLAFVIEAASIAIGSLVALVVVVVLVVVKCYRKVEQGEALIRNGVGGTRVSFSGMVVWPIIHRAEFMDIAVKRIAIDRRGDTGLICKDNIRADIQVAFFVRVNPTQDDVRLVAQSLGCKRASDEQALYELFDAKFSEALKTVGKRFEFTELYTSRDTFKEDILQVIGRDLNGYVLEDAAIDYLEQTDKALLKPDNILDAEGIKKITLLTASQHELSNEREREKEKVIKQQNVQAREAILELERQLAETEAKQKREIASAEAREDAETKRIEATEKEKAEKARIAADEEIAIAEENKQRQIIVAQRNKERTDKVEAERVAKDQGLEEVDRKRLVRLAEIDKDKSVEQENRELQATIRDRVEVEKTVVAEEEKIKDTREFATADRSKRVQITKAEEQAEQALVKDIKQAEAEKRAAEELAQKQLIEAEANEKAATRNAEAKKTLAGADVKQHAVEGIAEAEVLEAKAAATEKMGQAEANVMRQKYQSEAEGITEKAEAMKKFNEAGKTHEEFKLKLQKDLEVELADINVRKDIAGEQAKLVSEGLKHAKIDIVGGENRFFERLVNSITVGKQVDRAVVNSDVLQQMKDAVMGDDPDETGKKIHAFVERFGLSSEAVKNLSVSALMLKLIDMAGGDDERQSLQRVFDNVQRLGLGDKKIHELGIKLPESKTDG
jgi:uncharacterized membrane protein YqiK